jgi:hypothetical protein
VHFGQLSAAALISVVNLSTACVPAEDMILSAAARQKERMITGDNAGT